MQVFQAELIIFNNFTPIFLASTNNQDLTVLKTNLNYGKICSLKISWHSSVSIYFYFTNFMVIIALAMLIPLKYTFNISQKSYLLFPGHYNLFSNKTVMI